MILKFFHTPIVPEIYSLYTLASFSKSFEMALLYESDLQWWPKLDGYVMISYV